MPPGVYIQEPIDSGETRTLGIVSTSGFAFTIAGSQVVSASREIAWFAQEKR